MQFEKIMEIVMFEVFLIPEQKFQLKYGQISLSRPFACFSLNQSDVGHYQCTSISMTIALILAVKEIWSVLRNEIFKTESKKMSY